MKRSLVVKEYSQPSSHSTMVVHSPAPNFKQSVSVRTESSSEEITKMMKSVVILIFKLVSFRFQSTVPISERNHLVSRNVWHEEANEMSRMTNAHWIVIAKYLVCGFLINNLRSKYYSYCTGSAVVAVTQTSENKTSTQLVNTSLYVKKGFGYV